MKIFYIGLALIVIGGIVSPLFTYWRESQKINNKVSKGMKSTTETSKNKEERETEKVSRGSKKLNQSNVGSTQDLLDFDIIVPCNEDEALLRITDQEYLAILEVGGVSFNLLSIEERFSLEENYGNLLNGIDYEFQIYVQSRSLNLDSYTERYIDKVENIKKKVDALENKMISAKDEKEKEKIRIDFNKAQNQLEYGYKLLDDFRVKNVDSKLLQRKYYIILKYFHDSSLFENELSDFEILESAYNDLMIKSSLFIETLERNNLQCKVLNSVGVAELLYTSYNKEDASSLRIENVIKAKYNHLCTTSKFLFEKKIEADIEKITKEQKDLEKLIKEESQELNNAQRKGA